MRLTIVITTGAESIVQEIKRSFIFCACLVARQRVRRGGDDCRGARIRDLDFLASAIESLLIERLVPYGSLSRRYGKLFEQGRLQSGELVIDLD